MVPAGIRLIPMDFATIRYETEGPLAWITLNRPDKLNAISKTMVAELNQALDKACLLYTSPSPRDS